MLHVRSGDFCFLSQTNAHEYIRLAAVKRPVHKNNVKYLSGVSNCRARRNNSVLSVQKTDLVDKKTADLTTPKRRQYTTTIKGATEWLSVQNTHAHNIYSAGRSALTVKE